MLKTIYCMGVGNGSYYYLQITGEKQVSMAAELNANTSWRISFNGKSYTIFDPNSGLYLAWEISSKVQQVTTTSNPNAINAQWLLNPISGNTTTIIAYTSQKLVFLNGQIGDGVVNLAPRTGVGASGTFWHINTDIATL